MTETMIGHQSLAHVAELAALLRAHWNDREPVLLSSQLLEIAQVLDEVPKLTAENERLKEALGKIAFIANTTLGEESPDLEANIALILNRARTALEHSHDA